MSAAPRTERLVARAEAARAPISALFELTGRCNLDCGHCYLDIHHPPEELTTAEALRVVDELAAAGTFILALSGGELFLRKDALQVAAHARGRGAAARAGSCSRTVRREAGCTRPTCTRSPGAD